ncbi:MAG: hypothetical protein WDN72_10355 [Alphaproteobacteria bacterium]
MGDAADTDAWLREREIAHTRDLIDNLGSRRYSGWGFGSPASHLKRIRAFPPRKGIAALDIYPESGSEEAAEAQIAAKLREGEVRYVSNSFFHINGDENRSALGEYAAEGFRKVLAVVEADPEIDEDQKVPLRELAEKLPAELKTYHINAARRAYRALLPIDGQPEHYRYSFQGPNHRTSDDADHHLKRVVTQLGLAGENFKALDETGQSTNGDMKAKLREAARGYSDAFARASHDSEAQPMSDDAIRLMLTPRRAVAYRDAAHDEKARRQGVKARAE